MLQYFNPILPVMHPHAFAVGYLVCILMHLRMSVCLLSLARHLLHKYCTYRLHFYTVMKYTSVATS